VAANERLKRQRAVAEAEMGRELTADCRSVYRATLAGALPCQGGVGEITTPISKGADQHFLVSPLSAEAETLEREVIRDVKPTPHFC
jgi:hypothetical protein